MKNNFAIEVTINEDFSKDLYKDCSSLEAFKNWLCAALATAAAKQKMGTENFYLIPLKEEACFCLS